MLLNTLKNKDLFFFVPFRFVKGLFPEMIYRFYTTFWINLNFRVRHSQNKRGKPLRHFLFWLLTIPLLLVVISSLLMVLLKCFSVYSNILFWDGFCNFTLRSFRERITQDRLLCRGFARSLVEFGPLTFFWKSKMCKMCYK